MGSIPIRTFARYILAGIIPSYYFQIVTGTFVAQTVRAVHCKISCSLTDTGSNPVKSIRHKSRKISLPRM